MNLSMNCGTININGVTYSGNNVCISNGRVTIDGKDQDQTIGHKVDVVVKGNVENLENTSGDIVIHGDCSNIKTTSGDVSCAAIDGSVNTVSGDVKCKNIGGNVSTVSGDISKRFL